MEQTMEQIINAILGQSDISLQAFGLNVQTARPVAAETVQAKIDLVKLLDSIPAAHQFVEDFQIETVNRLDGLMKIEGVIGVKPTAEQVRAVNDKIDGIVGELETDLKNKILARLEGLGLGALGGLVR